MVEFKNFGDWLRFNAPETAQDKGELLRVLEEPMSLEAYSSARDNRGMTISKGSNRVHLRNRAEIEKAISLVSDCDVYDEDDLDEGYKRAMERPSND